MVAMYLSRRNLARSYTDIARAFGRHHTTIIHGERRVLSAPELMADALEISARLSNLVSWRERAKQQIEIHGFGNPARSNPCAGGAPAAVRPQPPMPPGRSFGAAP